MGGQHGSLYYYSRVANVVRMVDERKPFSDHVEVRPILNETQFVLIFSSDVPGASQFVEAF